MPPGSRPLLGAAIVGFLGYTVSLLLFVFELRHLGTARTGAYFSTAPFVGAVAAVLPGVRPREVQPEPLRQAVLAGTAKRRARSRAIRCGRPMVC